MAYFDSPRGKYLVRVAKAMGFYVRFGENGWERCSPHDDGATEGVSDAEMLIADTPERVRRHLRGEQVNWAVYNPPEFRPTEWAEAVAVTE